MSNFKILWILIISLSLSAVKAAQWAIVVRPDALVYADHRLISPIGKLPRGQKIRVGEVKRNHRTVLPMALNGKLAWIKIADIQIQRATEQNEEEAKKIFEHNIDELIGTVGQEDDDDLTQNNYLLFRFGTLSNIQLDGINTPPASGTNYEFQNEDKESTSFSLFLEHKNPRKSWHWGLGFDYLAMDSESATYETLAVRGHLSWVPYQSHLVSAEAFAGFLFSGDYRITFPGGDQYKGLFYGVEYGFMARLFPQRQFGLVAGLSFFNFVLAGLEEIENPTGDNTTALRGFQSGQMFAGLTYRF